MKRYGAYKNSGVEWIGEVPTHWALNRHKDVFSFISDRCINLLLLKVGLENIEGKTGRFITTESEFEGDGVEFIKNDILFGKLRPYLAKVYLADFNGNAVGDIFVYRPKQNVTPIFAQYLMLSDGYIDVINSSTAGAKMPRVSSNFIANLPVSTPPITEQFAITNYLDTKTAQIDRKLDLLSQKAAQYGKLKQSLINETVTRGLDKAAPMKDSGIEWIGEVPAHWEIKHLKNLAEIKGGKDSKAVELEDGGYPVYGSGGIFGRASQYLHKKPSVLLGRKGTVDKPLFVTEPFWSVDTMFYTDIKNNVDPKFFYYQCVTIKFGLYQYGSAVPSMAQNVLSKILFATPDYSEQQAIATYLDEKTTHIASIVATINTQIDKLKELRKALINDVVTGKICVLSETAQAL